MSFIVTVVVAAGDHGVPVGEDRDGPHSARVPREGNALGRGEGALGGVFVSVFVGRTGVLPVVLPAEILPEVLPVVLPVILPEVFPVVRPEVFPLPNVLPAVSPAYVVINSREVPPPSSTW